jgi:hypothetical protein
MSALRIFVASSSEGKQIANALRTTLQAELGNKARVELWSLEFTLGDTAIESLETISNEADFAVVVMTPDDKSKIRDANEVVPRDNLVFEQGLFIGSLGRHRSIVALDPKDELKLPSDILSVTTLTFDRSSLENLDNSLQAGCIRLAEHIAEMGPRPKWLAERRAALAANANFCAAIVGAWWEKVNHPDGSRLSFFTIAPDPLSGHVLLVGTGYGDDGIPCALWRSEMARLYPDDRRLTYLWRGTRPLQGCNNMKFHGYGSIDFLQSADPAAQLMAGTGNFWDVVEADPGQTMMKAVELRRVMKESELQTMSTGNTKAKRELVEKVLNDW